jgi:hypothetical protein
LHGLISFLLVLFFTHPFPFIVAILKKFVKFCQLKGDTLAKSRKSPEFVIPAKAGIQLFHDVLDPGFRRGDDPIGFVKGHRCEAGKNRGVRCNAADGLFTMPSNLRKEKPGRVFLPGGWGY